MPIFSYTVANKEGKQLNGNVEAIDESTARNELNNLGFSILNLALNPEAPSAQPSNLSKFIFEAIDKNSRLITGSIPAPTEDAALTRLHNEYDLTVTAIWKEAATALEIAEARKQAPHLKNLAENEAIPQKTEKSLEEEKKEEFIKAKIEYILKEVNDLLITFEHEIDLDQKAEINRRIDKILRIKNSNNLDYIQASAEELLLFIQKQEETLKQKGKTDKEFELKVKTQNLLNSLNKEDHKKTLREDILEKISNWYQSHIINNPNANFAEKLAASILFSIKEIFTVPQEILNLQENIKLYNKQIIDFIKLYFKEPTKEYKERVKASIKIVWAKRKDTIKQIQEIKKALREKQKENFPKEHFSLSFIEELNALTGWLLFFYVIYYFTALYLTTKDFGLSHVPNAFYIFNSKIFKYLLVTIFLLHSATALKVNFFRKSLAANIVLPIVFILATVISLLNF